MGLAAPGEPGTHNRDACCINLTSRLSSKAMPWSVVSQTSCLLYLWLAGLYFKFKKSDCKRTWQIIIFLHTRP